MTRSTFRLIAIAAACVLTASSAFGQWGGRGGWGDAFSPAVTTKQMDRYAMLLALSEDQKMAADQLLEGYQLEFTTLAQDMRARMEELREELRGSRDPSRWQEMGVMFQEFRETGQKLERELLENVKLVLSDDQVGAWPVLERERRRDTTINMGRLSGERVDVIAVVEDLELTGEQRAALGETLERYAVELDRALKPRNDVYEEFMGGGMQRMMFRGGGDMSEIEELFEKGLEASLRVGEVNMRFAAQVEQMLPADFRADFNTQVQRRAYPQIYRQSGAERAFEAVSGFSDVTPEQRESISMISAKFEREIGAVREKMARRQKDLEKNMRMQDIWRGFRGDEEMEELRDRSRELTRSASERLREVLTPDQAERLPRAGDDDRERRDMRRGGGRAQQGARRTRDIN